LLHDRKSQHKLNGFQKRRVAANSSLRDVTGMGRWGNLGIWYRMILIVPN